MNNHFSADELCKIIRECRKSGVSEFKFLGIEVIFDLGDPGKKTITNSTHGTFCGDRTTQGHQYLDEEGSLDQDSSPSKVENQPQVDARSVEKLLEEERLANLLIEDPLQWELTCLKETTRAETEHRGSEQALQ